MRKSLFFLCSISFIILALNFTACNNSGKDASAVSKEDSLKMVIERGKYLAHNVAVCIDCHSKRDFSKFSFPPASGTEGIGASFPFGEAEGIPGGDMASKYYTRRAEGLDR